MKYKNRVIRQIPFDKRHRRAWLRFWLPRRKISAPPKRLVAYESARGADPEELLVILAGFARNADDARALMDQHGVKTWRELMPHLPAVRRNTFRARLRLLLMRIGGHDYRNPWRHAPDRVPLRARWRSK